MWRSGRRPWRCRSPASSCSSPRRAPTCTGSTTRRTSGSCSARPRSSPSLAVATGVAAPRGAATRGCCLVSLAFLAAAGFLGLHALATPGVLLDTPNAGFVVATAGRAAARGGRWPPRPRPGLDGRPRRGGRGQRAIVCRARARRADGGLGAWPRSPSCAPLDDPHRRRERRRRRSVVPAVAGVALYARRRLRATSRSGARAPRRCSLAVAAALRAARPRRWSRSRSRATGTRAGGSGTCSCSPPSRSSPGARAASGTRSASATSTSTEPRRARARSPSSSPTSQGFTAFSERHDPAEVRRCSTPTSRAAIPPVVRAHGGDIDRLDRRRAHGDVQPPRRPARPRGARGARRRWRSRPRPRAIAARPPGLAPLPGRHQHRPGVASASSAPRAAGPTPSSATRSTSPRASRPAPRLGGVASGADRRRGAARRPRRAARRPPRQGPPRARGGPPARGAGSARLAVAAQCARRTLPQAVFGSSSANSTMRGYL